MTMQPSPLEQMIAQSLANQTGGDTGGFDPQARDIGGGYGQDARTGQFYRQDATGNRIPVDSSEIQAYQAQEASRPRYSVSSNSSVSQSLADPRELELAYAKLDEDRRALDMQDAREKENLKFLREKFAIETQESNARGARETQALMEQINARIETNGLKRAQMQMEQKQYAQQIQLQKAQQGLAERKQGFDEFAFGQEQENQRIEQRRALANDIANYARNPGDVGAQAAFLRAQGTGSPISTALASGGDARTDESLMPLAMLLEQQDALNKQGSGFGGYFNQLNQSAGQMGQRSELPWEIGQGGQQAEVNRATWLSNANSAANEQGRSLQDFFAAGSPGVGMQGDGSTRMDWSQVGALGGNVNDKATYQRPDPEVVYAANGFSGVVSDPTVFVAGEGGQPEHVQVTPQRTGRAMDFLNNAARMAMQKTGFGSVPTPVGLSTPGMNPYLQEIGAGIAGTARGIDPRLFLSEAQALAPQGLSGSPMRRTR